MAVYSQILIATSLIIGGAQDVKVRAIDDIVWIPAVIGGALTVFELWTSELYVVKTILFVTAILVAIKGVPLITGNRALSSGDADLIALILVALDPLFLTMLVTPLLAGVVMAFTVAYLYVRKEWPGKSTVSADRFRREHKWIPVAIISGDKKTEIDEDVNSGRELVEETLTETDRVEVTYGLPNVTFWAIGYGAFMVGLALFYPGLLASTP